MLLPKRYVTTKVRVFQNNRFLLSATYITKHLSMLLIETIVQNSFDCLTIFRSRQFYLLVLCWCLKQAIHLICVVLVWSVADPTANDRLKWETNIAAKMAEETKSDSTWVRHVKLFYHKHEMVSQSVQTGRDRDTCYGAIVRSVMFI